MKGRLGTYGFSALIHGCIISLVLAAGVYMKPEPRPLVIDFSLDTGYGEPSAASALPPPPETPEPEPPSPPPPTMQEPEPVMEAPEPPVTEVAEAEAAPIEVPEDPVPETEQETVPETEQRPNMSRPADHVPRSDAPASGPGSPSPPGEPGPPGTSTNTAEEYMKANLSYIRDHVQNKVEYPVLARKFGWEGSVKISFIVHTDGRISGLKVAASSGRKALDVSALDAVSMAAPFPPPPVMAELVIPVVYRLQ